MGGTGYPKARHGGLVIRELPEELLVYDAETHGAHCLNETAALVWKQCDGRSSVPEIAAKVSATVGTEIDDDVVWLALEDLWKRDLLVGEPAPADEGTMSRAQLLRRSAVAAAVAVPVIVSVVAPKAAHAATCLPLGAVCTNQTPPCCRPNICLNGLCQASGA